MRHRAAICATNAKLMRRQVLREPRLRNVVYRDADEDRIVLFNVAAEGVYVFAFGASILTATGRPTY